MYMFLYHLWVPFTPISIFFAELFHVYYCTLLLVRKNPLLLLCWCRNSSFHIYFFQTFILYLLWFTVSFVSTTLLCFSCVLFYFANERYLLLSGLLCSTELWKHKGRKLVHMWPAQNYDPVGLGENVLWVWHNHNLQNPIWPKHRYISATDLPLDRTRITPAFSLL